MTTHERSGISRRALLAGASAAALTGLSADAFAKAPMLNTQAPGFYRFRLGAFEATAVSDGPLNLGEPQPGMFKGLSKEDFTKTLTGNFLPTDQVKLQQNTLVVNTGEKLVLIDTGTGTQKLMGDQSGKLLANLKAAGINAEDIDAVALTHAHPDHCWGLLGEGETKNFPNAQIYMAQEDFDFWTDQAKAAGNDMLKGFIDRTRKQLLPLRERIVFFKDGQEFIPGIQAISAPGHTVGHTIFMITSEGKSLCNTADLAHHHVVSLERPQLEFTFDTDGAQGARTRMRMFGMLAAQRIPILAYHFPWPGIGYVAKQGSGFRFYPSPLQTAL
jgi:glyoxylase-like metal-dependent hydrolase (beta-lactamase superfamily II)